MIGKEEYRRNLPHILPENAVYFITYRIAGSIPSHIIHSYIKKKENNKVDYFEEFDDYLNNQKGTLTESNIANIIKESLWFYNEKYFKLISFCIMSSHVHLVINTNNYPYKSLHLLLKSIKGVSSNKINKLKGQKGPFWHHESYDRVVRDRNELSNVIMYTLNNPVKACLVDHWMDWEYSYIDEKYIEKGK